MVEALLGRRDSKMAGHLPLDIQEQIKEITARNSVWDSALVYISKRGHAVPADVLPVGDVDRIVHYLDGEHDLLWAGQRWWSSAGFDCVLYHSVDIP